MPYFDIHCHLDKVADAQQAVSNAQQAGLKLVLTQGLNPANNREVLALAEKYSIVQAALGLYPNDAIKLSSQELEAELDFIRKNRPVAIGEVGLDYYWDDAHQEEMKAVFRKVLALASEIKRPVIIHSRRAEEDVVALLEEFSGVKACLHCFSGKLSLAKQAVRQGAYFSIPANVTTSSHFQRLVEETPLNRLLTETDSPYLSPSDEENEPATVVEAVAVIARLKGLLASEAKNQLWLNQQRFLR